MSIKKKVKVFLKSRYLALKKGQKEKRARRYLARLEKVSAEPITDLTPQQEAEIRAFWKRYGIDVATDWHRYYYAKTGRVDPRFVPDTVFHGVIKPRMNNDVFGIVWSDKAYIDFFLRDVKTVRSVVRNVNGRFLNERFELIGTEEAARILSESPALVIKPTTYTETGRGVKLLHAPYDLPALTREYKQNFVLQLPIRQHPGMALLNESSVNTMRINSVLLEDEAEVMCAFVKAGKPGGFTDNDGVENRVFIGVTEDGNFTDFAFDHDLNKFYQIPSGYAFAGQPVPEYAKVCEAVRKAHKNLAHFGFAFWDVAVDDAGDPVIVEVNLRYPDSFVPQMAAGPFFGRHTERILDYVMKSR